MVSAPVVVVFGISYEAVVKMGYDSDIPRITCQGACEETVPIVNEVVDYHFHEFLRNPGEWGRTCDGRFTDTPRTGLLDSGLGSVPDYLGE